MEENQGRVMIQKARKERNQNLLPDYGKTGSVLSAHALNLI